LIQVFYAAANLCGTKPYNGSGFEKIAVIKEFEWRDLARHGGLASPPSIQFPAFTLSAKPISNCYKKKPQHFNVAA
jgi:hypothetical protein